MRVGLPVMIATALQNAVAVHSCLTRRSGAKERNFPVDWASVQCIVKIYTKNNRPGIRSAEGNSSREETKCPDSPFTAIPDRRNQRSRDALVTRVVAEFEEMPASA